MKTILRLALLLLAAIALPGSARAESVSIEGLLITASNDGGQTDRRLAPYEATLRRILRFETFRLVGSDQGDIVAPGHGSLSLGQGHALDLEAESADGRSIHVKVRWTAGGRTLMNTGLNLRPGVPAVIGGPATGHKGEAYAVILIGR
jgi:hypothetical protein